MGKFDSFLILNQEHWSVEWVRKNLWYYKQRPDYEKRYAPFLDGRKQSSHRVYAFPNGLGASIAYSPFSFGREQDKLEFAVIEIKGPKDWKLYQVDYPTSAIICLHEIELEEALEKVQKMEKINAQGMD